MSGPVEIRMSPKLLLFILSEQGCQEFTKGDCLGAGRHPLAKYGADQMCVPCMAKLATAPEEDE